MDVWKAQLKVTCYKYELQLTLPRKYTLVIHVNIVIVPESVIINLGLGLDGRLLACAFMKSRKTLL